MELIKNNIEPIKDFSSFIFSCEDKYSIDCLYKYLINNEKNFHTYFKDIEIIIVIPILMEDYLDKKIKLNGALKDNCYILTVANWESWDISIFTGITRANGDYTYILDAYYPISLDLLSKVIRQSNKNYDIYLFKQNDSHFRLKNKFENNLLYWSFKFFANIPVSPLDRKEIILSRRALNSILRNARKNILLLELAYRSSYPFKKITIRDEAYNIKNKRVNYQRRVKWSMFMRLSDLPTKISSYSTLILLIFIILTSTNALLVRLFGTTLILTKASAVPGWAYIVIVFSIISLLLNISIYAIQKSLMVIYDEISNKNFEVNSYKRLED